MDARMKERLVGAVVLVLAAVLFIPMVLDGPGSQRHVSRQIALPEGGESSRRTVRIDLDSATGAAQSASDTAPANVEEGSSARFDAPAEVDLVPEQEAAPTGEQPEIRMGDAPSAEAGGSGTATPEPRATDSPWTVQAGSFSQPDNAEALAARLRKLEFPAYVSEYNDGARVHYRVRVGGFPSRDAALKQAEAIRARTGEPASPVQNR